MSPMVIAHNQEAAKRRIRAIRKRVENPVRVWPRVGRVVSRSVAKQFASKGAYFGTPWKPLQPDYLAWKLASGYPSTILVMTGEMRETFRGRPMDIEVYGKHRARFGSKDIKAVWHQYGTRHRGRQINPPRPMLFDNPVLSGSVRDVIAAYVVGRRGSRSEVIL